MPAPIKHTRQFVENIAPQIIHMITIHQEVILNSAELTTQSWWCAGSYPESKSGWSSTEPHHDNLHTSRSKKINMFVVSILIHSKSPYLKYKQKVEIEHYFDAYWLRSHVQNTVVQNIINGRCIERGDSETAPTVGVKIKFTFCFRTTVVLQNILFHFYGFFHFYVSTIADSAITGFERNE